MREPGPPKKLEAAVGLFLPPACREHVLGDLSERYRGIRQYVLEVLQILPLLVMSRLRRSFDPQALLIEAFAVYLSFVSWQFLDASFLYDHSGFLRLAVPAVVTLGILLLVEAYANREERGVVTSVAAAAGTVLGAQLVLGLIPRLGIPIGTLMAGGLSSVLLVFGLRRLFSAARLGFPWPVECQSVDPDRMSATEFRVAAMRMYKRALALRLALWVALCLQAVVWVIAIGHAPGLLYRVGCGVCLVGSVYGISVVHRGLARGRLPQEPNVAMCVAFFRAHLEGRRDVLLTAWPKLLSPMLAGTLIVFASDPRHPDFRARIAWSLAAILFYGGIGWLARRRVPGFDRQLQALERGERP